MYSLKATFFTLLLFTASFAAHVLPQRTLNVLPCHEAGIIPCGKQKSLKIVSIEEDTLAVPLAHQLNEDVEFAVNKTSSGFGRTTSVGVSVQIGTTATLEYEVTTKAISSERISKLDSTFVSQLNTSEKEEYFREKRSFRGGLGIPFLKFVGINLGASTDRETMRRAAERQVNYNKKSNVVQEVLESVEETDVTIKGKIKATGVSFVPVSAFAFIKTARITFSDGSTKRVVTSDPSETEAATIDGSTVFPSDDEDKELEISEPLF